MSALASRLPRAMGVRVHLLGLHPARGSQSRQLLDEADGHIEWFQKDVEQWLEVANPQEPSTMADRPDDVADVSFEAIAKKRASLLEPETVRGLIEQWEVGDLSIPGDIDRSLLAHARNALGRMLEGEERHDLRSHFREFVKKRL